MEIGRNHDGQRAKFKSNFVRIPKAPLMSKSCKVMTTVFALDEHGNVWKLEPRRAVTMSQWILLPTDRNQFHFLDAEPSGG